MLSPKQRIIYRYWRMNLAREKVKSETLWYLAKHRLISPHDFWKQVEDFFIDEANDRRKRESDSI